MAEDKDTENREKIMKEEVDKAVMALIPKLIEQIFDAAISGSGLRACLTVIYHQGKCREHARIAGTK